ncbi:MgtC/SapB family protein [Nocardia grenadensis]|uniref:MgtC/SapB family protein n=1 Tax=Nocardia grenadensis TaxID=931537 RepID=UPI0007A4EF71|nr:MgtC/SapB family protein [Nocardia grenadensis]
MTTVAAVASTNAQGVGQIGQLLLAFALSSIIGLERQFRGKSGGLRTQAIVGTASALFMIVSKYGFGDVLSAGTVALDPSRVAAQVVSGIGFLGAGLIITRRGAIHGLTTAASVWETAAIGMTAGSGLVWLALLVTGLHFVIVLGYTPLGRWISRRGSAERGYIITYEDGRGVLREVLSTCTRRGWVIDSMAVLAQRADIGVRLPPDRLVTVALRLRGQGAVDASAVLGGIDGVVRIDTGDDEND